MDKTKRLNTIILIAFTVIFSSLFWLWEYNYLQLPDQPIEIDCNDLEMLEKSVGKYVLITNACAGSRGVIIEEDSKDTQLFPLFDCTTEEPDSVHLFSVLENPFFTGLYFIEKRIEDGEVSFFEGELDKGAYYDRKAIKILNEIGITYSEKECFELYSAKTPASTRNTLIWLTLAFFLAMTGILVVVNKLY